MFPDGLVGRVGGLRHRSRRLESRRGELAHAHEREAGDGGHALVVGQQLAQQLAPQTHVGLHLTQVARVTAVRTARRRCVAHTTQHDMAHAVNNDQEHRQKKQRNAPSTMNRPNSGRYAGPRGTAPPDEAAAAVAFLLQGCNHNNHEI